MTAQDYGINFPYGATDYPYSPTHPHRGDDRPCPTGTPVVINGTTIGLTGATGYVFGAHLHIQEWSGTPANTRKPQNSFKPGRVTAATSSSDFGNYITITGSDGWNTSYCHLSQINVSVGQEIGVKAMIPDNDDWYWRFKKLMMQVRGRDMSRDEFRKNFVGVEPFHMVEIVSDSTEADQATSDGTLGYKARTENWEGKMAELTKAAQIKDNEINDLKTQATVVSGDTELLNSFGKALAKLIARLGLKG